jgi:hypothetical protein
MFNAEPAECTFFPPSQNITHSVGASGQSRDLQEQVCSDGGERGGLTSWLRPGGGNPMYICHGRKAAARNMKKQTNLQEQPPMRHPGCCGGDTGSSVLSDHARDRSAKRSRG